MILAWNRIESELARDMMEEVHSYVTTAGRMNRRPIAPGSGDAGL